MIVRLAATRCRLPATVESVASVMAREQQRMAEALDVLSPPLRQRLLAGLGLERVRVCGAGEEPYDLALAAARDALGVAGIRGEDVDLVIDYSTVSGGAGVNTPLAHRLSADLGAQALALNFAFAGCAGFHIAVKQALALMRTDGRLRTALLIAGDSPPPGSRSLLPITIQGDAGSAAVLVRDGTEGPALVDVEVLTLGHLHRVITLERGSDGQPVIRVDAARLEQHLMPVYYLYFHRLATEVLRRAGLGMGAMSHVIHANLSQSDRDGLARALGVPSSRVCTHGLREYGHTFASDLVLNYTELQQTGAIRPEEWLLFTSAGAGFTWGVTLARS